MSVYPKLINQKENAKYLICIISWEGHAELAMICLPSVTKPGKTPVHSDLEKTYWDISIGKWNFQARVGLVYFLDMTADRTVFSEQWKKANNEFSFLKHVVSPSRHMQEDIHFCSV